MVQPSTLTEQDRKAVMLELEKKLRPAVQKGLNAAPDGIELKAKLKKSGKLRDAAAQLAVAQVAPPAQAASHNDGKAGKSQQPKTGKERHVDAKAAAAKRKSDLQLKMAGRLVAANKVKLSEKEIATLRNSPDAARYSDSVVDEYTSKHRRTMKRTPEVAIAAGEARAKDELAAALGDSPAAIRTFLEGVGDTLDHLITSYGHTVADAETAVRCVDKVREAHEFLRQILSMNVMKIRVHRSLAKDSIKTLKDDQTKLAAMKARLVDLTDADDAEMVKRARDFKAQFEKTRTHITKVQSSTTKLLAAVSFEIKYDPLKSAVSQLIAKGELEKLDRAKEGVEATAMSISAMSAETSPGHGVVNSGMKLLIDIGHAIVEDRVIEHEMKNTKKTETPADIRARHDANPLTMAKEILRKQKKTVKITVGAVRTAVLGVLAAKGADGVGAKVVGPLTTAITEGINGYLEGRVAAAEMLLDKKDASDDDAGKAISLLEFGEKAWEALKEACWNRLAGSAEQIADGIGEHLRDSEKVSAGKGVAGSIDLANFAKKHPDQLANEIIKDVLGKVMKEIVPRVLLKVGGPVGTLGGAAQPLTGVEISEAQNTLAEAAVPGRFKDEHQKDAALHEAKARPQQQPITAINGVPVDVDKGIWSLFLKTDAERSQTNVPNKTIYRVALSLADLKIPELKAAGSAVVWGDYDPRAQRFFPVEIDRAAVESWTKYAISGLGYSKDRVVAEHNPKDKKKHEKDQPTVDHAGTWTIVTVDKKRPEGAGAATSPKYVVFQGDHVRWGQFQAQTVNYEGHESELGALVEPLKATKKVTLKAIPIG